MERFSDSSWDDAKSRQSKVVGSVQLVIIMLLFASAFLYIGISSAYKEQFATANFISTDAIVSQVSVRRWGGRSTSYSPEITYRYSPSASSFFTSKDIFVVGYGMSYEQAKRIVDAHPVGTHCVAYYDPSSPSHACLIKERTALPYIFAIVGLIPLAFAMWVLFDLFKALRNR